MRANSEFAKKLLVLAVVTCVALMPVSRAQRFVHNSFFSAGLCGNAFLNDAATGIGGGLEFSYGKWLLTSAGMRGQLSAQYANGKDDAQLYYSGSFAFFFDPITSIRGRNLSNNLRMFVSVESGLIHSQRGDNDFFASLGLGGDVKISDNWRLYGEMKCKVFPADFDGNERSSFMPILSLGATKDIDFNPTRSRASFETQRLEDDWFFQILFGVNSFSYKGLGSFSERMKLMTPSFDFGLGKRLTTLWMLRVQMAGLYTQSKEEKFSYYNVSGELVLDILSLWNKNYSNRRFAIRPCFGAGFVTRLDDQSHFLVSASGSLQVVYKPSHYNEVFLEGRYVLVPPRFARVQESQSTFSVGMMTLSVGYSYTFSKGIIR